MKLARRRIAVTALTSMLCLGFAMPVPALSAKDVAVRATGSMTINASKMVYTRLHVPRPARLSLDYFSGKDQPTPRFSNGTGFSAIVLVSEDRVETPYTAARLEKAPGLVQRLVSIGPKTCQLQDACDVAAGTYRLYVVTKDPLRVQITFQGLEGSGTITPDTPAVGELGGATESYYHSSPESPVEVAATGMGFSPEVTGRSNYMFSAFWFRGPEEPFGPSPVDQPLLQVGDAGDCRFAGSPPPEAYAPGCPTGGMGGNFSSFRALSRFAYLQWGSIANLHAGEYGRGNYAVHSGIRDPGFVGFWLDLTSR